MPKFKSGVDPRRAKGGRRPGAGRKTKELKAREEATEKRLRDEMFNHGWEILAEAIRLGKGGRIKRGSSPATIRHMVDKLLPPIERIQHSGNVVYQTNLDKPKK